MGKCEALNEMAMKLEVNTATHTEEGKIDDKVRKTEVRWLPWPVQDQSYSWIYNQINDLIIEVNSKFQFDIYGIGEQIQHATYKKGDHYDWHMDVGNENLSIRKFSMTLLLDEQDSFEGGELGLKLGSGENQYQIDQGTAIFFPSWNLHRVLPVTKGTRRSLVVWVTGNPYR